MAKKQPKKRNDNFRSKNDRSGRNEYREGKSRDNVSLDCGKHPNDVSWYAQNPQMLVDSASLAFNQIVGAPFTTTVKGEDRTRITPGIMVLRWTPAVGVSREQNSPINIAARNLYSFVRHANAGSKNYDSPDLMLYLLATSSAYAWLATMRRLYGILRFYTQTNRYLPKHLAKALGFNADTLVGELANMRYYINEYALKLNSLAVPNSIPYYQRHKFMNEHVYMDRAGIKAQFYAFRQNAYFKFAEMTEDNPYGRLNLAIPPAVISNLAQMRTFGNSLLDPIITSEEMNIMSGDIMKAFKDHGGLLVAETTDENYVVIPEYNNEVLHQMHNMHALGASYEDPDSAWISQDENGNIISAPMVARYPKDNSVVTDNLILDIHSDTPTPADVMVSTRLMALTAKERFSEAAGLDVYAVANCGSEIPNSLEIFTLSTTGVLSSFDIQSAYTIDYANGVTDLNTLVFHSMFDMAPILYLHAKGSGATDSNFISIYGDVDNYVPVGNQTLHNMHQCALLSMLAVPGMGVFASGK